MMWLEVPQITFVKLLQKHNDKEIITIIKTGRLQTQRVNDKCKYTQ